MGSAWTGDYDGRIKAFAQSHGHLHIWNYLRANPTQSLVQIADVIGDVAAVQIGGQILEHCLEQRLMRDYVLDCLVRAIHEYLPAGWGTADDFKHVQAVTNLVSTPPEPFDNLRKRIGRILRRNPPPPPSGWLPQDISDPLLAAAYDQAFNELTPDERRLVANGEYIKPPGWAYWAAIGPIWKSISIYEEPEVFLEQFAAVPAGLGHLFAAHWCQSEICNGGFHQFFHNSTGILAPEAVKGFQAIGMEDVAEIIRQAMNRFDFPYPRDRADRMEELRRIRGDLETGPFDELNNRFYEGLGDEHLRFREAADRYALYAGQSN